VVITKDSFLKDNTFSLEFDCLKEVSEFKLDTGKFRYAGGYFSIHRAGDLEERVYAL